MMGIGVTPAVPWGRCGLISCDLRSQVTGRRQGHWAPALSANGLHQGGAFLLLPACLPLPLLPAPPYPTLPAPCPKPWPDKLLLPLLS